MTIQKWRGSTWEVLVPVWKPPTYKSPMEVSVVLICSMVPPKGQTVLFFFMDVTGEPQRAILQSEGNKCTAVKRDHTDAFFSSQLAGDLILTMQSPGTNTLTMRTL